MRSLTVAAAAVVLGLALPADALAETRYVAKGGSDAPGCANAESPCASVSYAAGQAASGDTVRIGPGTFTESVDTPKALTFVGAGAGTLGGSPATTLIKGPNGIKDVGLAAFVLPGGGTLQSLRALGGNGDSGIAIGFGESGGDAIAYDSNAPAATTLTMEGVVALGGNGGPGSDFPGPAGAGVDVDSGPGAVDLVARGIEAAAGTGINNIGVGVNGSAATARILDSRVPMDESSGYGIFVLDKAQIVLESVDVTAEYAVYVIDGLATIRRSRLQAKYAGVILDGYSDLTPKADIVDSLVVSEGDRALQVETEEEASAVARVFGSTLIGHGEEEAVLALREGESGPATAILRGSIVRHLPAADVLKPIDLRAKGGTIAADFSSFSTRIEEDGGTATAPGSAANLAGDPAFIDPANGVFVLQNTSPLIDRGDPAIVQPGEVDLVGTPRSLDGNRDCLAAPDIGAYEIAGQGVKCAVDAPPLISAFGMTNRVFAPTGSSKGGNARGAVRSARKTKRGTKFTYTLSEPARVVITIERKTKGRKARHGGKSVCVKATRANRKAPSCARFVKTTTLTAPEQAGEQSTLFAGRVKGKPLMPGRYRAGIVATDAAGQPSLPRQLAFRIVGG
jgi:hypothetical protein